MFLMHQCHQLAHPWLLSIFFLFYSLFFSLTIGRAGEAEVRDVRSRDLVGPVIQESDRGAAGRRGEGIHRHLHVRDVVLPVPDVVEKFRNDGD